MLRSKFYRCLRISYVYLPSVKQGLALDLHQKLHQGFNAVLLIYFICQLITFPQPS